MFQSRLHYTQYQVNLVSIVAELGLYLPVPLLGFLCDRRGPAPASLIGAACFGGGYLLASEVYRRGPPSTAAGGGNGLPFSLMMLSFASIGLGTCAMYLAAVSTCAKNFGRGKHKGFALAAPIASFGLGGMWQSQVGQNFLTETNPDGTRGEVDVARYFLFLAILLFVVGLIGALLLRVVNEDAMISEAVEELERSGLLDDSAYFRPRSTDYGTLDPATPGTLTSLDKARHDDDRARKTWLLNSETRRFLADPTMWWFAAGFFLVTGPGEAFINNLGTLISTLYPSPVSNLPITLPATHVSIVAVTSTISRIVSGALSDLLAPVAPVHQYPTRPRRPASASHSLAESLTSLDPLPTATSTSSAAPRRLTVSRITLLLAATLLLSLGLLLLATGLVQDHAASRFWLVSSLIGIGYGAAFSLTPIIVSCVWGVENFATNWGLIAMAPALAATVWGLLYAAVYDAHAPAAEECYGRSCYQATFWGMAVATWVALGLWAWAWRGRGGWRGRGIAV